jgi:hypothetical protein
LAAVPRSAAGASAVNAATGRTELRVGGKYRIGRKVGSGAFGDIYLGALHLIAPVCLFVYVVGVGFFSFESKISVSAVCFCAPLTVSHCISSFFCLFTRTVALFNSSSLDFLFSLYISLTPVHTNIVHAPPARHQHHQRRGGRDQARVVALPPPAVGVRVQTLQAAAGIGCAFVAFVLIFDFLLCIVSLLICS